MNPKMRQQVLERLGIEQLPGLVTPANTLDCVWEAPSGNPPMAMMPVPGKKCPSCLAKGETVWVIPGKCCPQCGTAVN